jgi:ATP-dependent RNA helicase DeaD
MTTPLPPKNEKTPNLLPDITYAQLPERLRQAAGRANWTDLMPVQARAIPYLLAGRNVMIQARTGSGKTGAYLLPMLERLDRTRDACQALILVPTRELARQVWQETETVCSGSGLRSVAVYGGVGYGAQNEALKRGAHIVVGTPGRVLDHLLKRTLTLDWLQALIYDEADHMLSMGFYPDMVELQRYLPRREVHTSMFSATFPDSVLRTAQQFMRRPEFISLSSDHVHVTDTEHIYCIVPGMDKDRSLVRWIEMENPEAALIFCNTKTRVHYVTVVLQRFGYDADELSADLSQADRERVLGRVRAGSLRFLVATDVAARGLDIPSLSHVFLFEPPEDVESYIHRAGRTGRAGAAGTAITLVNALEKHNIRRVAAHYGIDMQERPNPADAEVSAVVAERLTALLEARLRQRDKLQTERSRRFTPLAQALVENEDELPIITMLLDDHYQQVLHAPVIQHGEVPAAPREKAAAREGSRPPRPRSGRGRRR